MSTITQLQAQAQQINTTVQNDRNTATTLATAIHQIHDQALQHSQNLDSIVNQNAAVLNTITQILATCDQMKSDIQHLDDTAVQLHGEVDTDKNSALDNFHNLQQALTDVQNLLNEICAMEAEGGNCDVSVVSSLSNSQMTFSNIESKAESVDNNSRDVINLLSEAQSKLSIAQSRHGEAVSLSHQINS